MPRTTQHNFGFIKLLRRQRDRWQVGQVRVPFCEVVWVNRSGGAGRTVVIVSCSCGWKKGSSSSRGETVSWGAHQTYHHSSTPTGT
jgi:hypothetical protein